jgi:hypothetical protein
MEGFFLAMLKMRKNLIPCVWMLGVIHVKDMHDHPIYDLYPSINFGVEGSEFGDLGVQ